MKVLAVNTGGGPAYHRVLLPIALMGVECEIVTEVTENSVQDIDILFFNRAVPRTTIDRILQIREKYGFKIIVDIDDYWILDAGHIFADHYKHDRVPEIISAWIEEADFVTTTHDRLQDEIIKINTRCVVLPNAIHDFGQFRIKKVESNYTRLFYSGSITHVHDCELLRNPLKRLNDKSVQVIYAGYNEKQKECKRIASALTNGGAIKHELISHLPVKDYYGFYRLCDIALVPLLSSTFNRYKSNLKVLEAAHIGAPVIVSSVHPYLDFPNDLVNYVCSQADWMMHIKRLLNDKEAAAEQGQRLKEYCKINFNFDKINLERKKLFENVSKKTTAGVLPAKV